MGLAVKQVFFLSAGVGSIKALMPEKNFCYDDGRAYEYPSRKYWARLLAPSSQGSGGGGTLLDVRLAGPSPPHVRFVFEVILLFSITESE